MKPMEWLDSKTHKPPFNKPVWGLFKGRDVELVHTALTEKEYADYFKYAESSWYSLESEKTGSVPFWKPLKRPEKPE
jgi:hypothetical protein